MSTKLMDNTKDILKTTQIQPKLEPLLPLTVLQIAIPIIPGSFGVAISMLLLFLWNPANDPKFKNALLIALCFNFSGVILIIFAIYILVSKWISHIMNGDDANVNSISFGLLYTIMKKRLMFTCGFGILFVVMGYIMLLLSCIGFFSGIDFIIFALPCVVLIGAFIELANAEFS